MDQDRQLLENRDINHPLPGDDNNNETNNIITQSNSETDNDTNDNTNNTELCKIIEENLNKDKVICVNNNVELSTLVDNDNINNSTIMEITTIKSDVPTEEDIEIYSGAEESTYWADKDETETEIETETDVIVDNLDNDYRDIDQPEVIIPDKLEITEITEITELSFNTAISTDSNIDINSNSDSDSSSNDSSDSSDNSSSDSSDSSSSDTADTVIEHVTLSRSASLDSICNNNSNNSCNSSYSDFNPILDNIEWVSPETKDVKLPRWHSSEMYTKHIDEIERYNNNLNVKNEMEWDKRFFNKNIKRIYGILHECKQYPNDALFEKSMRYIDHLMAFAVKAEGTDIVDEETQKILDDVEYHIADARFKQYHELNLSKFMMNVDMNKLKNMKSEYNLNHEINHYKFNMPMSRSISHRFTNLEKIVNKKNEVNKQLMRVNVYLRTVMRNLNRNNVKVGVLVEYYKSAQFYIKTLHLIHEYYPDKIEELESISKLFVVMLKNHVKNIFTKFIMEFDFDKMRIRLDKMVDILKVLKYDMLDTIKDIYHYIDVYEANVRNRYIMIEPNTTSIKEKIKNINKRKTSKTKISKKTTKSIKEIYDKFNFDNIHRLSEDTIEDVTDGIERIIIDNIEKKKLLDDKIITHVNDYIDCVVETKPPYSDMYEAISLFANRIKDCLINLDDYDTDVTIVVSYCGMEVITN